MNYELIQYVGLGVAIAAIVIIICKIAFGEEPRQSDQPDSASTTPPVDPIALPAAPVKSRPIVVKPPDAPITPPRPSAPLSSIPVNGPPPIRPPTAPTTWPSSPISQAPITPTLAPVVSGTASVDRFQVRSALYCFKANCHASLGDLSLATTEVDWVSDISDTSYLIQLKNDTDGQVALKIYFATLDNYQEAHLHLNEFCRLHPTLAQHFGKVEFQKLGFRVRVDANRVVTVPTVRMDWLPYPHLHEFIREELQKEKQDRHALVEAARNLRVLWQKLHDRRVVHGDYASVNIFIRNDYQPIFIDFDCFLLYGGDVDELSRVKNVFGHRGFQLPARLPSGTPVNEDHLNYVDDIHGIDGPSEVIIYLSLLAYRYLTDLPEPTDDGLLIFTDDDLANPMTSTTFATLETCENDLIKLLTKKIKEWCMHAKRSSHVSSLSKVASELTFQNAENELIGKL